MHYERKNFAENFAENYRQMGNYLHYAETVEWMTSTLIYIFQQLEQDEDFSN